MSAGTDKAQNAETMTDGGAIHKVDKAASIVGMDLAGTLCPTAGAGRKFWLEPIHERIK